MEKVFTVMLAELLVIKADMADGVVIRVEIKTVLHDKSHQIKIGEQTLSFVGKDVLSL